MQQRRWSAGLRPPRLLWVTLVPASLPVLLTAVKGLRSSADRAKKRCTHSAFSGRAQFRPKSYVLIGRFWGRQHLRPGGGAETVRASTRSAAAVASCFHSSASANQYFISDKSISILASAACLRHIASNAVNCFFEYICFPVVAESMLAPYHSQLTML